MTFATLAAIFLLPIVGRAQATTTAKLVPALGWDIKKQGGFPVSLLEDKSGDIWVGTEGNGLWEYTPKEKNWAQFTTKDGLGDDSVYALAIDQLGRIWAGHQNHGVSVYNGDKWKNYGLVDGPIGDHVFSIVVNPKDGDVWIATDMGLSRYSEKRQDWDYYSRASGLPSDQIISVAFDQSANAFAGTESNGVAFANPADDYKHWTISKYRQNSDQIYRGEGPAPDLINGLAAEPMNVNWPTIFAFSPGGIFMGGTNGTWLPFHAGKQSNPWMLEDWVTAYATLGNVSSSWIGFRELGVAIHANADATFQADVQKPASVLIRSILYRQDGPVLIAAYDATSGGVLTTDPAPQIVFPKSDNSTVQPAQWAAGFAPPPLPIPAPKPDIADAKPLTDALSKLTQQIVAGEAYYLADDWRTEGDWVGRYGGCYVKLCGMAKGDQDYALQQGYNVTIGVGANHLPNAANAVSFHDDETSNDLRSLYDPTLGHRRDAEENDFSDDLKVYPETYNGPDLWVHVTVPDGIQCLSLYFLNNEAHTSSDAKYRDYDVTVVPDYNDDTKTAAAPPLVRTRVTDFWGGVYKQFLVCGPANYVVRIGRNQSIGTRLQAVFIDRVTGDLIDAPKPLPGFDNAPYAPPDEPDAYHPTPLTDAAVTLWNKLDDGLALRGAIPLQMPLRMWCYRAAIAGQAPAALLERWRWQISIWTPDDRKKFDEAMKGAFEGLK
jgi:hypothetical protein